MKKVLKNIKGNINNKTINKKEINKIKGDINNENKEKN